MLASQCPCASEVTVNPISDPGAGTCPPPCEIAASATITIEEPTTITAFTRSYRAKNKSGTVSAGMRSISFLNDGGADAMVNGALLKAGSSLMFIVLGGNTTYGAIEYDATGTELRIDCTLWGAGAPYTWPTG
jgi:hypothetical protein